MATVIYRPKRAGQYKHGKICIQLKDTLPSNSPSSKQEKHETAKPSRSQHRSEFPCIQE